MERISRFRALVLLVFFCVILGLFGMKLFSLQIIETDPNTDNTTKFETITRVKAARGDILDRNGNILVGNRASYDLVFNHYVITSSNGPNQSLMRLIEKCAELGIEYIDHFPITEQAPFEYTLDNYTTAWRNYFQKYLKEREIDSDISAPLLVKALRTRYKIPEEWTDEQARAVLGLRYEFDLRGVANLANYTFMEDVKDTHLSELLELNIPGLMVESSTVREYHTHYAAHILGTMGAMTESQWQKINAAYEEGTGDKYYMDAQIGQSGFEAAFEKYLHGIDGQRRDIVSKDGAIISQEYDEGKEPRAGNNIETTIDLGIQMVAEDALADIIAYLQDPEQNPPADGGHDVEGAAVVVMEVKTGDVLACASYPTYDMMTYKEDYDKILETDFDPLYNRALLGQYAPGSAYKMTTLIAAMNHGLYQAGDEIEDMGSFDKYIEDGFSPDCLVYSSYGVTHKNVDAEKALECSCNYFFYELGDRMSGHVEYLDETAKALGLGEPTGVELNENIGYRANKETKALFYTGFNSGFFTGDLILASIGQSENRFTPMQLCVYASTLANKGTRMKATFLSRVVSSDYRELVLDNKPVIVSTLAISEETYQAYLNGMKRVVKGGDNEGTARNTMAGMTIEIAAKTGTAQSGRLGSDDGSFVCFAPADNPEIAIAVFGEKAAHGSTLGRVAKTIIEYYFDTDEVGDVVVYENQIG